MKVRLYTTEEDGIKFTHFNELEDWEDFDRVADFLRKVHNVSFGEIVSGPYSKAADFEFESAGLTLLYDDQMGVGFRAKKSDDEILNRIAQAVLDYLDRQAVE